MLGFGDSNLCAQNQPQVFQYPVTAPDVDPGIDHGNSDANLPEEFKKQMVFYRSLEPPGTIIIDTQERHLYLIQDRPTPSATASASAATVSPGRACCGSVKRRSGRTGGRRRK